MTKVMKICDRYIVWLLVQLGAEANTACAAFTSTPERAHQKPNITVADVSEISASEHEIGRM
jgi:hypothetical protein